MISEKIVVIDDDERVIKSVVMSFPEFEILAFQDAYKGIKYLSKPNDINLVLCDVMMPEINGVTVLKEIKDKNPDITVLMMSGYGTMEIAVQAMRNKAEDFIEKPFDIDELRKKIKDILKLKYKNKQPYYTKKDKIQRIKNFIDRNHSTVSLESLAEELSLSTKYVSRMFNQKSGKGFRDYKVEKKIEVAKKLLTESSYSISEISSQLGYANPESFMRIFKQKTDITPSKYRKQYGIPEGGRNEPYDTYR